MNRQRENVEQSATPGQSGIYGGKVAAVAPMMDWTDRHCRFFHRLITRRALLYTEMVVADAVPASSRPTSPGPPTT